MDDLYSRLENGMDKLEACDTGLYEQTLAQLIDIVNAVEEIVGE